MSRPAFIAALLLLATPASFAADDPSAKTAEVQRLRTEASTLRERQLALRTELNAVGDRIEALKAKGNRLLRQDALDAELRRSQELSTELTAIAAKIVQADEAVTHAQQAVVDGLSAELDSLRRQVEATPDREARRTLITRMRAVREERERFAAALPNRSTVPAVSGAASDDPEDLLEQADALRDSRDKVQKRLAELERRANDLRKEQELERRMGEFVESDSLFDENDRRLGRSAARLTANPASLESDSAGNPIAVGAGGGVEPLSPAPERYRDPSLELSRVPGDDLRALEGEAKRLHGMAEELEARAKDAERRALELR